MWHRWLIVLLLLTLAAPMAQAASTPTADFTDNGDGTVTHKTTGLTWKRCAEGRAWSGSTCSGTAKKYTWDQAMALGSSGWGLPTIAQLRTIVDSSRTLPIINTTIFPYTPSGYFWSASSYTNDSEYAWIVDFEDNNVGSENDPAFYKPFDIYVRLVQGGQSTGSSSTTTQETRAECVFKWAERTYPELLAPSGAYSTKRGINYYRYYPSSRPSTSVLSVDISSINSPVYYTHGNEVLDVGTLSEWLKPSGCNVSSPTSSPQGISGTWSGTLSGGGWSTITNLTFSSGGGISGTVREEHISLSGAFVGINYNVTSGSCSSSTICNFHGKSPVVFTNNYIEIDFTLNMNTSNVSNGRISASIYRPGNATYPTGGTTGTLTKQ